MAPLDMGSVMNLRLVDPLDGRTRPSPSDYDKIGAYLKAVREHQGDNLADLAERTRIRKSYLLGIEEGDASALPSRPFAIGYVRAYAEALDLDGEAAAARYKIEMPEYVEPLRNPVGVRHETRRGNPLLFALIGLVVIAVVAWNIVQRSLGTGGAPAPTLPAAAEAPPPEAPVKGPIALGSATPPPADQTLPAPYITPGLGPSDAAPPAGTKTAATFSAPAAPLPPVFTPKGAIYGAKPGRPSVILQAQKPASLVVRGADGTVYFARQLEAGQAYRAPFGAGLTADAPDPTAFGAYAPGAPPLALTAELTPVDRLAAPKAEAPKTAPRKATAPVAAAPAPTSPATVAPQTAAARAPQTTP